MPLATLESVCLAYGHVPLLDHASLVLESGERVGLIGRNGTGKSSLLKILANQSHPDDGVVWHRPGLRLAYVAQEPILDPTHTVFESALQGLGPVKQLLIDYDHVIHAVEKDHSDESMARLTHLSSELDAQHAWSFKSRVEIVLSRLQLNAEALVSTLSGGQKKRLALAQAMVSEPEVLLLDEPTNHLDISSIEWLESLLTEFTGALVLITHDRRFLDLVVTRIAELDRGRLNTYPGNFSQYQTLKAQQLADETVRNEKFDKLLAQEEVWIRRGIEARRTRDVGRIRRLEALRLARAARRERTGTAKIGVDAGERSGKLVAELDGVSKSFGDKVVVKSFSCRIQRGDRVGFVGPNGAGKTTLLKLILGELQPDAGKVRLGSKLAIAYYDQFRNQLDEEATVLDTVAQGSDFVEVEGQRKHVMSYLGEFLFPPQRVRSPVKSLSGGERNRLLLARLFTKPVNLLVLDEPTNDLDIETLELLESLLQEYEGTVFLVSHDRAFLDNVVTQVIAWDGPGNWVENPGGYDEWMRVVSAREERAKVPPPAAPKPVAAQRTARPEKLSFKETQELKSLPATIESLEKEQTELSRVMSDAGFYKSDPADVKRASERVAQIEQLLSEALERWTELEAKAR
ncbi:MAG: ATP-binding cassette domain-containing protein [Betaproteobacteria bacterium]|nr:ATP-binding cassette domain-containing protein [Betaproteobacteria bacterium]